MEALLGVIYSLTVTWALSHVSFASTITSTITAVFLPVLLRTLLDKCHNYSEQSLRSWWTWHGPRWNLLSHVTKNGKRSHVIGHMMLYMLYVVYIGNVHVYYIYHVHHVQRDFLGVRNCT